MIKKLIRQTSLGTAIYMLFTFICTDFNPFDWAIGWRGTFGLLEACVFLSIVLTLQGQNPKTFLTDSSIDPEKVLQEIKDEIEKESTQTESN